MDAGRDEDARNLIISLGSDKLNEQPKEEGGLSLLHHALLMDHGPIIEFLLYRSVNVNARTMDDFGITPLHIVARNTLDPKRRAKYMELMLKKGARADIPQQGNG